MKTDPATTDYIVEAGATRNYTLTIKAGATAARGWSFGSITWASGAYAVRSVIALNRVG